MRFGKKILAVLMILTMVVGLSVTTFAGENRSNVTVRVIIDGDNGTMFNDEVTLDANAKLDNISGTMVAMENRNVATMMDAIIMATTQGNYAINYFSVPYTVYNPNTQSWEYTGVYGIAFDTIGNLTQYYDSQAQEYHYWEIEYKNNANQTSYTTCNDYASHYVLTSGMVIHVNWTVY